MCSGVLSPQYGNRCCVRTFGQVSPPRNITPLQVCGSSGSTLQGRSASVSPPKHDLWVFGGYHTPWFITPPNTTCGCSDVLPHPLVYHTPTFITPPNVPCGWSDVLSHPLLYHTPWGPPRPALYHRGYTRYHTPPTIPHPVIIFSSAQMYHRGCVILCSLR